jgi:hypothetical protein
MRSTRKTQRKALTALVLGLATAAIFTTTASAQARPMAGIPEGDNYVANLVRTAGVDPFAVQHVETPYLSWGATADDLGPFKEQLANQSTRDGGPVFMNGVPDGYVGSGVEQQNLSGEGVTPTNLARAVPHAKAVESATVSASSDSFDRGDLALGFGLGLILAAACAIAVAMTRDRQHTRMAHS